MVRIGWRSAAVPSVEEEAAWKLIDRDSEERGSGFWAGRSSEINLSHDLSRGRKHLGLRLLTVHIEKPRRHQRGTCSPVGQDWI